MDPTPIAHNLTVQYGALGIMSFASLGAAYLFYRRVNALTDSLLSAFVNNTDALRALREGLRHD